MIATCGRRGGTACDVGFLPGLGRGIKVSAKQRSSREVQGERSGVVPRYLQASWSAFWPSAALRKVSLCARSGGEEARAVAEAADLDRLRPDEFAGQAAEQFD